MGSKQSETEDNRRRSISGQPINPDMGEGRWQDALRRMRKRIEDGLKYIAWDSTYPGDKDTHVSWGMCSNDVEQWPTKDDHTFPDDFESRKRVSPRHAPGGCPLDHLTGTDEESRYGCFYRCRAFSKRPFITGDDRKLALRIYDEVISNRESREGIKTVSQDNDSWVAKELT